MTVGDTATLTGGNNPSGSVTFTLYSDGSCHVSTGISGSGAIAAGVASYSQAWTPAAVGTYTWGVSYPGDSNNNGFTACGGADERSSSVSPVPRSRPRPARPAAPWGSG